MSENKYSGAEKAAEVCTIWPTAAAAQMGKMVEQCRITDTILSVDGRIAGGASVATRAGFVAEEIHAETFNLDAILKGKNLKAFTDRYKNSPLSGNNPVNDIVIMKDGQQVHSAQLKYRATGEQTANDFRESRDGVHRYKDADSLVTASDKIESTKEALRRTELNYKESRPQVSEDARIVQKKVSDRLTKDGVESKPLSKKEAEIITKANEDGKKVHRKIQNKYKNASTLQQTARAAGSAAVVTSVIAGTINTIDCLNKVKKGEMTADEATFYILKNTAIAAGDSALKAASATAAVSLTVRTLPELFKGSMLQSSLVTGAVAGTTICAVDLVQCLVLVAAGKMTIAQLEERTGKNIFQTGAGVLGSSIGAALGAPAGPVGSLIGGLVGGMITSVAMTVAIENHIEKPYKELLDNTQSLVQAEMVMNNSVQYIEQAQLAFEHFKVGSAISEYDFRKQMDIVRKNGELMWGKINNLK